MNRLTGRYADGKAYVNATTGDRFILQPGKDWPTNPTIVEKLAAYEDCGLEPGEVAELVRLWRGVAVDNAERGGRRKMALWSRCAICGRGIPVGEPCYGIKEPNPLDEDTICRDCLVLENTPALFFSPEWVSTDEVPD